jgi:hypothetical protein
MLQVSSHISNNSQNNDNNLSEGQIAGVVIGVVALLLLIVSCVYHLTGSVRVATVDCSTSTTATHRDNPFHSVVITTNNNSSQTKLINITV